MKLVEINDNYYEWILVQNRLIKKQCKKRDGVIFGLFLVNLICIYSLTGYIGQQQESHIVKKSIEAEILREKDFDSAVSFSKNFDITGKSADIKLQIPQEAEGTYRIVLYIEGKKIYQSEVLYPGTELPAIDVTTVLSSGNYLGTLVVLKQQEYGRMESSVRTEVTVAWDNQENNAQPYIVEGGKG